MAPGKMGNRLVDIVEALLGKENISRNESLSDMCGENGDRSRANLSGKITEYLLWCCSECFFWRYFKRIASGEPISTRQLYKDVATLTDYAKMLFCLNELPRTNDKSNGYFRRFQIVPSKVKRRCQVGSGFRNWPRRLFLQSYPELWTGCLKEGNG